MKKLKITILTALIAICCYSNVNAQATEGKTKGKILDPGPKMPRIIFSAGYGNTMPSSTTKDAYFTNSSGISGDLFVPFLLFRKGWDGTVKGGNYGFTIAGSYNFGGNGDPSVPLPNAFAITGQTASSVVYKGVDPRNPGFRIGGGPQANFYLMNHLILSPIVLAEYFSTTQKTLSAVQTTQVNGQTKEYILLNMPETKNTGFSVTPKLRISYFLAENFGIFADAGYVFGPKVNTQTTSLKPEGNPNQAGQYNQQQLDAGTQVKSEIKSTSYQAFAVNVGLSLAFGGKKGWNGMTKTDDKGWNGKANISNTEENNPNANKTATTCSCKSVNMYSTEYPATALYSTSFTSGIPNNMPSSELTSGNKLHFYFPNAPFNTTVADPCYAGYKAVVNGHTIISYGPSTGADNHIQFPVLGYLVVGTNTITITSTIGTTVCTLASKVINVTLPATPTAITLAPECCTVTTRVGGTSYDGNIKFKITGVPNGCAIKIVNGSSTVYAPIINGTYTSCFAGTVTAIIVDATTLLPVAGSTINGLATYNYTKSRFQCRDIIIATKATDLGHLIYTGRPPIKWADEVSTTADLHAFRLVMNGTTDDGGIIKASIPADEENGQIYLSGAPEITKTLNGKTTTVKSNFMATKKHNYVGHITLLR